MNQTKGGTYRPMGWRFHCRLFRAMWLWPPMITLEDPEDNGFLDGAVCWALSVLKQCAPDSNESRFRSYLPTFHQVHPKLRIPHY